MIFKIKILALIQIEFLIQIHDEMALKQFRNNLKYTKIR